MPPKLPIRLPFSGRHRLPLAASPTFFIEVVHLSGKPFKLHFTITIAYICTIILHLVEKKKTYLIIIRRIAPIILHIFMHVRFKYCVHFYARLISTRVLLSD